MNNGSVSLRLSPVTFGVDPPRKGSGPAGLETPKKEVAGMGY